MQIRTWLTIQFALLVSSILLVSFLVIFYFTYSNTEKDFYSRLWSKAESMAGFLSKLKKVDNELLKTIDESNPSLLFKANILIFDERNSLIYSNVDKPSIQISNYWLDQIRRNKEIRYKDGDYYAVGIFRRYPFNNAVVLIGAQDVYGKINLQNLRTTLVVLFFAINAIVIIVGWLFARRALLPISRVMNDLENILPLNLNIRLPVPNQNDEIGRLSKTFNQLLDRIEHAFRIQKTFVANVSHELKNPLAKISSQLEVSLLKERTALQYQVTLNSVLDDVQELSRLSSSLLELAKVSEDRGDLLTEKVRIDEIILDSRRTLVQANRENKVSISFGEFPADDRELEIAANPALLKTAIINLMDNACKFSPDRTAFVRMDIREKAIEVSVMNTGTEIREADKDYIFQPFYRANNTANVKGYGIGLSLTERIVRLHGASISITTDKPGETTFTIKFPNKVVL